LFLFTQVRCGSISVLYTPTLNSHSHHVYKCMFMICGLFSISAERAQSCFCNRNNQSRFLKQYIMFRSDVFGITSLAD